MSPPGVQSKAQSRRSFLGRAGVVALGAAAFGAGAFGIGRVRSGAAARARDAVTLPPPADPAPPLPAGVGPGFYTRNADFYRVDTALTVPAPDVDGWRLKITGMVDRPVELSFDDLLKRGLTERDITLNCVSNEVGGPYIGTARWLGVPLGQILREAGVQGGADQVVARGSDGMTIGTPVTTVLDTADAMLVVGMNGEPLPAVHGFPVRMLTPGLYGYAGSCKWITELELSTFDRFDAYWVERGWAPRGPVKTASRIDRPAAFAKVAGRHGRGRRRRLGAGARDQRRPGRGRRRGLAAGAPAADRVERHLDPVGVRLARDRRRPLDPGAGRRRPG